MLKSNKFKLFLGIFISVGFLYLAFRKVDLAQMAQAFAAADYWYVIPAVVIIFISHWLRAVRWQYLIAPIASIEVYPLFSSLIIGYMFNLFLPAHLGEFVRAYILGKKRPVAGSAIFGTIVIERILDVLILLVIMALAVILFPFPEWVKTSGYLSFVFITLLFLILVMFKKHRDRSLQIILRVMRPFPSRISDKMIHLINSFLDGIVSLKQKSHYVIVAILSILIWACYAFIFQLIFYAFDFTSIYSLPWIAALVLLVITTISVLVPSSPGYVGTYHYLCQLALSLFGVAASPALSFAVVVHGINFLPVLFAGLIFISIEGLSIKSIRKKMDVQESAV